MGQTTCEQKKELLNSFKKLIDVICDDKPATVTAKCEPPAPPCPMFMCCHPVCFTPCDAQTGSGPANQSGKGDGKAAANAMGGGKEGKINRVKQSKSRELRGGVLYIGCDCEKLNGLQDDCPRSDCRGAPPCLTKPPTCGPSEFSQGKHLKTHKKHGKA